MDTNVLIDFLKQELEDKLKRKNKQVRLTETQLDFLRMVIDGKPTEIIAYETGRAPKFINNTISSACKIISDELYSGSKLEEELSIKLKLYLETNIKEQEDTKYKLTRNNIKYIIEELFKRRNSGNSDSSFIKSFRCSWKEIIRERAEDLDVFNLPNSKTHSNLFIDRKLKLLGSQEKPRFINHIIESFIEDNKRPFKAFIYGCSGLGKTSLLKRIALDYIKENKKDYLPILISLRRFSSQEKELSTYIYELFAGVGVFRTQLQDILQTEKVLILFDCLSGGQEENRNTLVQLEKFVLEFNKCSYIITSNVQSYYIEGFKQYELTYFDQSNIDCFITQWFTNKCISDPEKADFLSKNLKEAIKNFLPEYDEDLLSLPFYLSLFCQVYYQEPNINSYIQDLTPPKPKFFKIFLYIRAISSLLIWDEQRQIETIYYKDLIDEKRAFDLFCFLAFEILLDRKTRNGYVKKERIQELIKNFILSYPNYKNYSDYHFGKIIEEIEVQDGILIQKHSGYYCFIHTSILYFFAANYLIKQNLDIQKLKEDCFSNEKWKIVIEMAKEILDYYKFELEHNSSRLFLSKTC
ncbi:NACHT domain-containing protein [Calothrix membranacea FACHB-236]|nr:NACHT domain-containing protein [Calothrix membranacea FACHB-236]